MKNTLLLLMMLPSFVVAQVDSLKEYLQYYPLRDGDYWEYRTTYDEYSLEIIGDSLLPNGNRYKILFYKSISQPHDSGYYYERIDSLSGNVFVYDNNPYDSRSANEERRLDSLFVEVGESFFSSCKTLPTFPDYFTTKCQSVEDDTVLGKPTITRNFSDYDYLQYETSHESTYSLAKGFGLKFLYESGTGTGFSNETDLVYARIDGLEYGVKLPTRVSENVSVPTVCTLFQNYPNPFNPTTIISYQVPVISHVTLKVYDVLGREVKSLVNERQTAGSHSLTFNATDLPSGVYFYRLQAGSFSETKKLLLLK